MFVQQVVRLFVADTEQLVLIANLNAFLLYVFRIVASEGAHPRWLLLFSGDVCLVAI